MRTAARLAIFTALFAVCLLAAVEWRHERCEAELADALAPFVDRMCDTVANTEVVIQSARRDGVVEPGHLPILMDWLTDTSGSWLNRIPFAVRSWLPIGSDIRTASERRAMALAAFEVLGTNAAPALPELRQRLKRDPEGSALLAAARLGMSAWPLALELASGKSPDERQQGAFLLGMLRVHEPASAALLIKLADASEPSNVRREALTALAEFPAQAFDYFAPKLAKGQTDEALQSAAYGLHLVPNAAVALIRLAEENGGLGARLASLAALELWEQLRLTNSEPAPTWPYVGKRHNFDRAHAILVSRLKTGLDDSKLWSAVKSNLAKGRPPGVVHQVVNGSFDKLGSGTGCGL